MKKNTLITIACWGNTVRDVRGTKHVRIKKINLERYNANEKELQFQEDKMNKHRKFKKKRKMPEIVYFD